MKVVIGTDILLQPVGTRARGWGWEPDTRAAIEWLEANVEPGMTVADVGTGTGILALVAHHLGAKVTAFESEWSVRQIARENFELNGADIRLLDTYSQNPRFPSPSGFDLVVANLGEVDYGLILEAGRKVWTTPAPGLEPPVPDREPPDWVAVWDESTPDEPPWKNPWIDEEERARRYFDG